MQYVIQLRISEAQMLLRDTDYSVRQVAKMTGYQNFNYFLNVFKKKNRNDAECIPFQALLKGVQVMKPTQKNLTPGYFSRRFCVPLLWGSAFPCVKMGYQLFQISSDATFQKLVLPDGVLASPDSWF